MKKYEMRICVKGLLFSEVAGNYNQAPNTGEKII